MLRYNLLITLRGFKKFKTSFFINVIGLTTGLTSALFIYLWVQDEFSIDKFHEKDEQLYQVMSLQTYAGKKSVSTDTPALLGQDLKTNFPEIKYSATTTWIFPSVLSYNNTVVRENGYHAGKDFFNIFTYPLIIGDPDKVLNDKTSICISRDLASKLFGSIEKAVGKTIKYGETQNFTVSGVFENINKKSTYMFDFVLPLQDFLDQAFWANDWSNSGPPTYIVLQKDASANRISTKIEEYLKTKVADSETKLFLKKYSEQYLNGRYSNGVPDGGRIDYVKLFSVIAIFILLIACINFMNLSTAYASKRAKEVGIRKAIGAERSGLIRKYIGEAIIISLISMLLAYGLIALLLGPFNTITNKSIELSLNVELIVISIGTIFILGTLAGSYPALYLSHFKPMQVIKNEIKNSAGEIWARKGLVIFQFTITIILLIGVIVIHRQTQYLNKKHLGYNRDNVISFQQDGNIFNQSDVFFNELKKISGVSHAGGVSHSLLGKVSSNPGLEWEGKNPNERILFERFYVNYDFYKAMEFQMAKGRWFDKKFQTDSTKLVINEAAAKVMGFSPEEAIGQHVRLSEDSEFEIIGVLEDFHYMSLHEAVGPAYFRLEFTWNVLARLVAGKEVETINEIKTLYQKFAPDFIFNYSFLDVSHKALYESEKRVSVLSSYFAGFAIIISCLGLFGLAAFTAERRIKEIGIRKVLGASTRNIVLMLSKDFISLVLASIVIALPLAYFLMEQWLTQFAYKINLAVWMFVTVSMVSLIIAWVTVGTQALKAALTNPVKSLRAE